MAEITPKSGHNRDKKAKFRPMKMIKYGEKMRVFSGWIDDKGNFYPAKYVHHEITGRHFFGEDFYHISDSRHFIHLGEDGMVSVETKFGQGNGYNKVSQAQLDTLFDIATKKSRKDWKREFSKTVMSYLNKIIETQQNEQTR